MRDRDKTTMRIPAEVYHHLKSLWKGFDDYKVEPKIGLRGSDSILEYRAFVRENFKNGGLPGKEGDKRMGKHKCSLEEIAKSDQDYSGTQCGDIAPYVSVLSCKDCHEISFIDNPGYDVSECKLERKRYMGRLSQEDIRKKIPTLSYQEAYVLIGQKDKTLP